MKLLRDKLQVWLGPGVTGWKLVLGHTISASLWLSMVGILVSELYISENVSPVLGERVSIVCAVAMMMSFYLRPPWEEEETEEILDLSNGLRTFYSKFVRGARTLFTVWIVLLGIYVSEIGLRFFVEEVYSNIPQEFGGAQPRCARLDVVTDQLSVETRKAILSIDSINSESQVVQTIEVNVFFSGSEFMLVKPLTQEQEPKSEVYEIRRSVIQAVTWCSQRDR
ncbi:MAG: hypothetical protein HWN68_20720 [Desulfobacterales bacterium]|nr:hypothetical protein [Desulfobacterales bacterium]